MGKVYDIKRRVRLDLYTPAEKAIWDAMVAVELMEADVRLTNAGMLLGQAKDLVSDYIDEQLQRADKNHS